MRGALGFRRVNYTHRHLSDRPACTGCPQDHLGFEAVTVLAHTEPQRSLYRVAAQAALRVGERSAAEQLEKEIGKGVRKAVRTRCSRLHEITHPEHQRMRRRWI